jgi:GH15 family glucan-1,4-alpha-glucosidase
VHYLRTIVDSGPLQPVYGIGGERELPEEFLPHLAGFGGNGHVRIGNAACSQQQHDLMGEVVLCLETLLTDPRIVHEHPESYLRLIDDLVERAITARGDARHRDLGVPHALQAVHVLAGDVLGRGAPRRAGRATFRTLREAERWGAAAERLRARVLDRGFNRELGFFTQALDGQHADASNLLLPSIGLIDARDPRFVSTVRAYEKLLVVDGAMLRYRNPTTSVRPRARSRCARSGGRKRWR